MNTSFLKTTLPAPERPISIPENAQWLAGEGAGSWFSVCQKTNNPKYHITRFSPDGIIECSGFFNCLSETTFNLNTPYFFTYLSHCQKVTLVQNKIVFVFERCS